MNVTTRVGLSIVAVASAALIAAGCGGGGSSKAADAAKDSKILDLVPKTAIGYATVDTDLTGDGWKQFDKLAGAFDADFKGVGGELTDAASEDDVDFTKDVDPWLGATGGAALLSVDASGSDDTSEGGSDTSADFFVWVELDDVDAFEAFAKKEGLEQGEKLGDYETFADPDDDTTHIAYNDEYILLSDARETLDSTIKYDGDSITDVDGVSDAIDEVGGDALATIVVTGEGIRTAIADNKEAAASLGSVAELDKLDAVALAFGAEDEGLLVSGYVGASGDEGVSNAKRDVLEGMPANTVLAIGGHNLGGGLKSAAEEAGKSNPQIQQIIGQGSAALGVSVDDLAKAFAGEFALGLGSSDEGLGTLAGTVTGAAMGGGVDGLDPAALVQAVSVTLAFEETGTAKETLDKLTQAAGGFLGAGAAPETGTKGDFETSTMNLGGLPLTTAASDDVAAISLGVDVFEKWGSDSLADNDAYKAAVDASGAPGEAAGFLWLDAGRIADFAGVKGNEDVDMGGLVGWLEGDDANAKFGLFLHIESK